MENKRALAYYRTSSAANVGTDKDSLERQQEAVRRYARQNMAIRSLTLTTTQLCLVQTLFRSEMGFQSC